MRITQILSLAVLSYLTLLAAGCTPSVKPAWQAAPDRAVSCEAGQDCKAKWSRAEQWIAAHSPYAITLKSDSLIETAGPSGLNDSLAFILHKKAIITRPDVKQAFIGPLGPDTHPESADTRKTGRRDTYSFTLDIKCNNWFTCTDAKRGARTDFVNFVMGLPAPPKPAFGIKTNPLTPYMAQKLGMPDLNGLTVAEITPHSPAEKVGLRQSDIIVQYDGAPVTTESALLEMIAKTPKGRSVSMVIIRGMARQTMTFTS